jgi:hypothetical protein
MAYTPPVGAQVALALAGAYSSPPGDQVAVEFRDPDDGLPPVVRYTVGGAGLPWQAAPGRRKSSLLRYGRAVQLRARTDASWATAPGRAAAPVQPWAVVPRRAAAPAAPWTTAPRRAAQTEQPWGRVPLRATSKPLPWGMPPRRGSDAVVPWSAPPRRAAATEAPWGVPPRRGAGASIPWALPPLRSRRIVMPWSYAPRVRWRNEGPGVDPPTEPPNTHYTPPRGNRVALALICPQQDFDGDEVPVPLGPAACYFAWPRPRRYIVLNSAAVVRLPERTPVPVSALSLRTSVDDVVWALSMQLADPAALSLLLPDGDGPKTVEVNVNGYVWTAIIESYDRERQFPAPRVSVSGRSQAALLDAPFAAVRSFVQTAERQAQQLIDEELDLTEFTADYQALTWLVPGGVWHYDALTPLAAVREVAAAAGAVVQSHPWDKVLVIAPRYPTSPWDWTATAPDKHIPDDIVIRDSLRPASAPLYDYVLVSGEQVGVSDPIQRTGSAGAIRAQQIVDKLITTHPVALERGRNVLSDRGEQALVSLDIPLFPTSAVGMPGLVLPLQLVEVVEPTSWLALAVGCEIEVQRVMQESASVLTVTQSITLERHYSDAN